MKKTVAKYLCIILSVAMLVTALPLTVYAEDSVFNVSTAEQLSAAYTTINNGNGGEYTINLTADIIGGHIDITKSGAVVTVNGNGYAITNYRNAVNVSGGATVKLSGGSSTLTLQGSVDPHEIPVGNDEPGLIYVLPGSTCTISDNVTLKNHKGNNYLGGGVTVEGGTFVMDGGTIENCGIDGGSVCYGGGVAVFNGGYFEMNGGTIKNCYVKSIGNSWQIPYVAGGGVMVLRANFTMNGGTIEKCSATNYDTSEKVDALGGGVAVITSFDGVYDYGDFGYLDSNVTMNGGTIKDCTSEIGGGALAAGLWYINNRTIGREYKLVPGADNPGIFLNGVTMTGNDSSMGGAIFLCQIRPTVNIKNMVLNSNSAEEGGAINVFYRWTHAAIEGCTLNDNSALARGGAIMLDSNIESSGTYIKDTTIKNNTSGDRGAGVYYDSNSQLTISGANIIQDNYYNNVLNNLNIFSQAKPVYVNGDLTGSKVGLSDPKLWDDGKEDTDPEAVSTGYLTSGYKANNSNLSPSAAFTSDHESWLVDYSDTNINEVRLVRKKPNYHINNDEIDDNYNNNDIFTSYVKEAIGKEIKVGDTIEKFYKIPEVKATESSSCPYIFKGWYYDKDNDNDSNPVNFGTDKYSKDIYAHWIKVEDVAKDEADDNELPPGYNGIYGGFDLAGVQVREGIRDTNYGYEKMPGGLRFVTSLNMDVVKQINAIKPNNIEYGYVAATNKGWIDYHKENEGRKLQYVSNTANGIDTSATAKDDNYYFGFASNINCTSSKTNGSSTLKEDHRNFENYLLYTLVITYENVDDDAKNKNVLARPYIRYSDANGLERVAYSEYKGSSNTLGGCYTSYNAIAGNN